MTVLLEQYSEQIKKYTLTFVITSVIAFVMKNLNTQKIVSEYLNLDVYLNHVRLILCVIPVKSV